MCSFSPGFCQKLYEKTIFFKYKFKKFLSRCTVLQSFMIWNILVLKSRSFRHKRKLKKWVFSWYFHQNFTILDFLLLKWQFFLYNAKIWKQAFFYYWFSEASVKNFIKTRFLNKNFQNSFTNLLYETILGTETFCY